MNGMDPSLPEVSGLSAVFDEELSVEQVAEMAAYRLKQVETLMASAAEPTADQATEEAEGAALEPIPMKPVPIEPRPIVFRPKRRVSGRYRSSGSSWQLELRVDVDGTRPMRRVSGDYFYVSGATTSYFGSFVVNAPHISVRSSQVTITGVGTYTFSASAPKVRITIPRVPIWYRAPDATLQHYTLDNVPGGRYICKFRSAYFRTVDLEQDHEQGVTPFSSYDTGSLPSGGPARVLTITESYAEAGVLMRTAGTPNTVPVAPGTTWNNAELHAAMLTHFSLWKEEPQWKVWLLHAMRHDYGLGLLGIMFDQQGKQRQGCATFYGGSLGGTSATARRSQLYTCVHELGHCFNLFHSFHKTYMTPPMPNRLCARSWMNYPQNYPGGSTAFWSVFPFQFDGLEVIHLRHAYRNNIIMGGNPFGVGAALEYLEDFGDPVEDQSGLRLELEAPAGIQLGTPPVVEIKLYGNSVRGKQVHKHLHPNFGFVQLAIRKPDGNVIVFEPPIEHCIEIETATLDADYPSIYESAYIGYDKHAGVIFDLAGTYTLRGVYYALDGSRVLSNVLTMRVMAPLTEEDEKVAELLLGDDQGMLFYLLGSDSAFLQKGNDALNEVLEEHGEHPLAVYAQLVKGFNASREFKTLTADYQVEVRDAQPEEAIQFLSAVVDASEAKKGVDNVTLNMTMRQLARTHMKAGDEKAARTTINRMGDVFLNKGLRPHVEQTIKNQQEALRAEL